jgi:hypothetical protein
LLLLFFLEKELLLPLPCWLMLGVGASEDEAAGLLAPLVATTLLYSLLGSVTAGLLCLHPMFGAC